DAMTPDELASQPHKASWKRWIIALACVLAIIAAALLLIPPTPERVKIWSVGSTNVNGKKMLVFEGTNGTARRISYYAATTTNTTVSFRPPDLRTPYNVDPDAVDSQLDAGASPGERFTFSLAMPPKEPAWRVVGYCIESEGAP